MTLPSPHFMQGAWTTVEAFESRLVFNGAWRHLAIAVSDTKSDALPSSRWVRGAALACFIDVLLSRAASSSAALKDRADLYA